MFRELKSWAKGHSWFELESSESRSMYLTPTGVIVEAYITSTGVGTLLYMNLRIKGAVDMRIKEKEIRREKSE